MWQRIVDQSLVTKEVHILAVMRVRSNSGATLAHCLWLWSAARSQELGRATNSFSSHEESDFLTQTTV